VSPTRQCSAKKKSFDTIFDVIIYWHIVSTTGNTEDETPVVPVKAVEKTSTHTAKRNTDGLPPKGHAAGNRRGGANVSGNEAGM
jgi:Stm1.